MRLRRVLKWVKRILLGTLALVILLVAIGVGVVHTTWGREQMRHQIESQLQEKFPGSQVGAIEGSVFGTVVLSGVTIAGKDGKPFVSISTVRLGMSFKPLMRRVVRVDSIEVEGVLVDMAAQPDPKPEPPITSTPAAQTKPSAWDIDMPSITVHDARLLTATGDRVDDIAVAGGLRIHDGILSSTISTKATWRGQAVDVAALVEYGKTLRVPYAHASLGAASLTVAGVHVSLDGPLTVDGSLSVKVPSALIEVLAADKLGGKPPPGDIAVVADAHGGAFALDASIGPTRVHGLVHADLDKLTGEVLLGATDPDGQVALALTGGRDHARGIIAVAGAYGVPVDMQKGKQIVSTIVTVDGSALVAVDLVQHGDAWQLASALVSGVGRASMPSGNGHSSLGEGTAVVAASGALSPVPQLVAAGTIDGRRIAKDDLAIGRAHITFDAKGIPDRPIVATRVEVDDIHKGALVVPSASITATTTIDPAADGASPPPAKTLPVKAVVATGKTATTPAFLISLAQSKTVKPGPHIAIDLGEHRVQTADGKIWTGVGGHVDIDDEQIDVKSFQTGTGTSTATANATISRTTDDIAVDANVKDVALAMLDPKLRGTIAGEVKFKQHHGGYSGHVTADARGVVMPGRPMVDGHVSVGLSGRRVTVDGTATSAVGGAHVAFEVTGPANITDPLAWQRLQRSALKKLTVGVTGIDATKLGGTGTVDGELTVTGSDASGSVHAGGIVTKVGTVDTTLTLSGTPDQALAVHVDSALTGVKPISADATFGLPLHPFDPTEWGTLGRRALREASIHVEDITFDHALLARLGVDKDFAGSIDATVTLGAGATTGTLSFDLVNLRGPSLRVPITMHLAGTLDPSGVNTNGKIGMGKAAIVFTASSPLSIDNMATARAQKVVANLKIPRIAAKDLLALFGRQDIAGGDLDGTIDIAGTIGAPTAHAHFAAQGLTVVPTIATTKKSPKLEKLDLDVRWAANHGELELEGIETGGKIIKLTGRGTIGLPQSVTGSLTAAGFDIAPLVAFAPGALGAARGTLDAGITLTGIDPQTGDVRGVLHITDGRLPLTPSLGTLRKGDVNITIVKQDVTATIDGKIGAGSIKGKLTAKLVGAIPTIAELNFLEIRKLSPIGITQPVIDADISGKFTRTGTKWNGKLAVKNASIYVPPDEGVELLDTGAPSDIFFINEAPPPAKKHSDKAPWLFADIEIARTKLLVDDADFQFDGTAKGQLQLKYGAAGLVLDGEIATEQGTVDVLGRRYQLDHGIVAFDGTVDPRLDIRLVHDFTNLTLTVDILGRSSNPDPRLSSDPGNYTEGQLFAFLMGAEPGDDSGSQAGAAVVGGGLTVLSSRLGRKVTKHLPFKVDGINYEAATASSSGALRAGIRLSERSHLVWRQHFQPRPDENPAEAVLEYVIRPWALIEATAGERAGGGDLLLRHRW